MSVGNFKKVLNVFVDGYDGESEAAFADISGHWAQENIERMASKGIINGIEYDDKMYFRPEEYMTRAQFAQATAKLVGIELVKYANTPMMYEDGAQIEPWAQNAAKAMYENGIMKGRTSDTDKPIFAPNDNITRAEAMTILGRLLPEAQLKELDFADKADVAPWAAQSMEKLYAAGIIKGYSDHTILPNNRVKRAEAVTLMNKLSK